MAKNFNKITLLVDELLKIKNRKILENFLLGLLTKQEIEELPVRIKIVRMLKAGIPQKEIAKKLGVGIATVTRGSKEVKIGHFINIK